MDEKTNIIIKGPSGKTVDDFTPYCEGDAEQSLQKIIKILIEADVGYIVYIDDENYVQWSYNDSAKFHGDYGKIANRLRNLETISRTQLHQTQYKEFACLLAEGMARLLGDEGKGDANESLDKAEVYLRDRGGENARRWYVIGSSVSTLPILILVFILAIFRCAIIHFFNNVDIYEITCGALFGGFGALFFILTRSGKIPVEPAAGSIIHYIESGSRILTGVLGALLIALAIKSNTLLGILKDKIDHPFIVLLVICFCAGASERFVPGFIKKVEKSTTTPNE